MVQQKQIIICTKISCIKQWAELSQYLAIDLHTILYVTCLDNSKKPSN